MDDNKKFYENGDYVGLIEQSDLYIEFRAVGNSFDTQREMVVEFYENSCSGFEVYVSADGTMRPYLTVNVKNGLGKFKLGVESYRIWLQKFNPKTTNQKIKIASISTGGIIYFQKANNISLFEEIKVLSDDLPINSFSANIITGDFSFTKDTAITVSNNARNYGTFYISNHERQDKNVYLVEAENSIKRLEETEYSEWGSSSVDLDSFISQITELSGVNIAGPDDLKEYALFGHIPIKTARYALCAAAFVCGFMVNGSRGSDVMLTTIPSEIKSQINGERIIGKATYKKEKEVTSAKYDYIQRNYSYEEKYLEPQNEAGIRTKLIYEKPSEYFEPLLTDGTEITVHGQSDNYIDFTSPQENIKLPVLELTYPKASVSIVNPLASAAAKTNTKSFDSFGLLGIKNTQTIKKSADILKFIQSQGKVTAKIILENEKVGDLIQIETALDGIKTGIITSMDIHFGYRDVADIEVLEWNL